jgi:hypothetical protein
MHWGSLDLHLSPDEIEVARGLLECRFDWWRLFWSSYWWHLFWLSYWWHWWWRSFWLSYWWCLAQNCEFLECRQWWRRLFHRLALCVSNSKTGWLPHPMPRFIASVVTDISLAAFALHGLLQQQGMDALLSFDGFLMPS